MLVAAGVEAEVQEEVFGAEHAGGEAGEGEGLGAGPEAGGVDLERQARGHEGPVEFDARAWRLEERGEMGVAGAVGFGGDVTGLAEELGGAREVCFGEEKVQVAHGPCAGGVVDGGGQVSAFEEDDRKAGGMELFEDLRQVGADEGVAGGVDEVGFAEGGGGIGGDGVRSAVD